MVGGERRGEELRFLLLGPFTVLASGRPLPDRELGSRKGRTLLKLLLLDAGQHVSIDRIVASLWTDEPGERPDKNVAALVSRLRRALGADLIARGREGYCLTCSRQVTVDLHDAGRLLEHAEERLRSGQPALALNAAQAALRLFACGPLFADGPDALWVEEARRSVEQQARAARRVAWRAALTVGEFDTAAVAATGAEEEHPFDEEACRALMIAHARAGRPGEALIAFERLRMALAQELGADPGPETRALHAAVLRGEEPRDDLLAPIGAGQRTRAPSPHTAVGLVGRARETDRLSAAWTAATQGQGNLLVVAGEAGVGKTRIAAHAKELVTENGGVVLEGRCFEAERSLFLQPVADALSDTFLRLPPDVTRRAAGQWASVLTAFVPSAGEILRPSLPHRERTRIGPERATTPDGRPEPPSPLEVMAPFAPGLEQRRAFDAVSEFLSGLARHAPVLFVLDDLHLAGETTVALVHYVRRRLAQSRVLLLVTARTGEGSDVTVGLGKLAEVMELAPLSRPAVAELARQLGVPDAAEDVATRTGGQTLFAVETLRAIAEGADPTVLPESLRAAVLTRVARLGTDVEQLLRVASVLGGPFSVDDLAQLLGSDAEDVAARAERALAARLLLDTAGGYVFAHDLVRQALYESTPDATRVARHRRVTVVLALSAEAVAVHAAAGHDWGKAAAAFIEAGEQALTAFANHEAQTLFTHALEAAQRLDDPHLVARALTFRGQARERLGAFGIAREDHEQALALAATAGDETLEAAALERIAWTAYHARDGGQADPFVAAVGELAERAAAAPAARPTARALAGRLRHAAGDLNGAADVLAGVLAGAGDEPTRALAQAYLGTVLVDLGRYLEAERLLADAERACKRTGLLLPMLGAISARGFAQLYVGELEPARQSFERLHSAAMRYGCEPCLPAALIGLSRVWTQLGSGQDGARLGRQALEAPATFVSHAGQAELRARALVAAASGEIASGDEDAAALLLEEVPALLELDFAYRWLIELDHLELRTRLEPALATDLLSAARACGSPRHEALALARLGQRDRAADIARSLRSELLLSAVAPGEEAAAAAQRIAVALPDHLRDDFLRAQVSPAPR